MIRNLLFHCYPLKGSVWPWHADQLARHRPIWNGRRLLVLALDHLTDSEDLVREKFAPLDAEILVRQNERNLHEAGHFVEALSRLESLNPDEAVFYAHAKGVTRSGPMLEAVRNWSRLMYEANLSLPSLIDRKLASFMAAGCLRWTFNRTTFQWCYPGTFFWLKHSAIFSRDWRDIRDEKHGVEDYPGRHFRLEESCCLTREQVPPISLYEGFVSEELIRSTLEDLRKEDSCTNP